VKLSRLPGWEKNSWGYHGDDWFSFSAEKNGTPYGPKFGSASLSPSLSPSLSCAQTYNLKLGGSNMNSFLKLAGDVVGCGVDFSQNRAFYTKDGAFLGCVPSLPPFSPTYLLFIYYFSTGNVFDRVGSTTPIYPSVGLRHSGEAIRVNFGHEPFKFSIEDHVLQARNVTWAAIMNTPLRREFITNSPPSRGGVDTDSDTKPDVHAMDVAAAAAMGSEGRGPINQLVLSYLSHHGYAKTARAFQAQCETRGGLVGAAGGEEGVVPLPVPAPTSSSLPPREDVDVDMDMDLTPPSKKSSTTLPTTTTSTISTFDGWGPGTHPNDIELRTRIVNSVIEGDIDTALNETARWHPKVLEREEGLMLFKLRCRKFVELILEAAELKKRMRREEAGVGEGKSGVVDGMDVDDGLEDGVNGFGGGGNNSSGSSAIPIKAKRKHSISHSDWTGAAAAQYESALSSAILYGQALQSDYKTDSRSEVRAIFNRTFGVVAYEDPLEAGGDVAEVAGQEARVALATELNQDILRESPSFNFLFQIELVLMVLSLFIMQNRKVDPHIQHWRGCIDRQPRALCSLDYWAWALLRLQICPRSS
jgi:hypothetical protein